MTRSNCIMTLEVYQHLGLWVFDDHDRGLMKEPFVGGMTEIIDTMVKGFRQASSGFRLMFSAMPFPDSMACLKRTGNEFGGTWYRVEDGPARGMAGWLCPALYKYFNEPPACIYVSVSEIEK